MSQHYSDPKRADDPHALPNIEVFYLDSTMQSQCVDEPLPIGWYWQACFPGCLPDSEPFGPYNSEAEAAAAAQEDNE